MGDAKRIGSFFDLIDHPVVGCKPSSNTRRRVPVNPSEDRMLI